MRAHFFAFAGFLFLPPLSANACEFFGGAMPAACPPEATQEWWDGSWATREVDSTGAKLTAFTTLMQKGEYKTTLVYDSGKKLEHFGHYKLHVNPDLSASFVEANVSDQADEAAAIGASVDKDIADGSFGFGGALPSSEPPKTAHSERCLRGEIEYFVEGSNPPLRYTSPQKYNFITQGKGYVRVNGPGAENVLARKYSG